MLASLSIRDIVLIDRLNLSLSTGLNVLTGETGAGKSILLDSLGLALGMRADRALVRSGCQDGAVTAAFDIKSSHTACQLLIENGFENPEGEIILKRHLSKDGKSRAWINDQPVTQQLLKHIGELLVEIHGQHDDRGLLHAAAHRDLLDLYGQHQPLLDSVKASHLAYEQAKDALRQAKEDYSNARDDEEWLRHAVSEIDKIQPQAGEERDLADKRAIMMQGERLSGELKDMVSILSGNKGVEDHLNGILRKMGRMDAEAQALLETVISSLERASIELSAGAQDLDRIQSSMDYDPLQLEETEERLFDLRALARKHNCQVDDLAVLSERLHHRLKAVDSGDQLVKDAEATLDQALGAFATAVKSLHEARHQVATKLSDSVMAELPPMKLEKARFRVAVHSLPQEEWSAHGGDRVWFEMSANPGADFGPLVKVASGGEMARVILALKVVLARSGSAPVMIFDEVDRGIGGATADAVGERLRRLAGEAQVLVVTHSPQVAARGHSHMKISKAVSVIEGEEQTRTSVYKLPESERTDEIARMLAGAEITPEARAAADKLLAMTG
ncbi:DNA repair protein RecN [Temperatibacter marinus]|uniref:DNA repair protein RecN n=1 Tax=Temperatibacter marinus TaxID=1456591 RepID=A0AA52H960_9PROT|nr:DNA repair protein RecN [Temperatibacter marinus]WND02841.1 DNA repair protein RecN [Temperatibacter marinus]